MNETIETTKAEYIKAAQAVIKARALYNQSTLYRLKPEHIAEYLGKLEAAILACADAREAMEKASVA